MSTLVFDICPDEENVRDLHKYAKANGLRAEPTEEEYMGCTCAIWRVHGDRKRILRFVDEYGLDKGFGAEIK
jgi:hypothetical protein